MKNIKSKHHKIDNKVENYLLSTKAIGNLNSYIQLANTFPVLSLEEEKALSTEIRCRDNVFAAQELIQSHLRFVIYIAKGFSGYGLQLEDIIQEGNVGLIKASKRFNSEMGVRFVSYAVHWIKAEIYNFVLQNWRIVKVATTKAQRKLFFNIRKNKSRLGWFSADEINTVAKTLNVNVKDVIEMESRMNNFDHAFDLANDESNLSDNDNFMPNQYLEDANSSVAEAVEAKNWEENRNALLDNALTLLDERSKDIIQQRWLKDKKTTLINLASKYQISAERIRQLERNALDRLKFTLTA